MLKQDSHRLAVETEELALRFEGAEAHYTDREEMIYRDIGLLNCEVETLKTTKRDELESSQNLLKNIESQVRSAENEVADAERKLEEQKKKAADAVTTGAIAGAVLGLFTFGIAAAAGPLVGAGVAALIDSCNDQVRDAKSTLERHYSDYYRAKSVVEENLRWACDIEVEASRLEQKIKTLENEQLKYHEKVVTVKNCILFVKNAVKFWQLFKLASEHCESRAIILQTIILDQSNL